MGKKVIFLLEHLGKAELHQLIDDGSAEQRLFGTFNDILGDRLKQADLLLATGLDRENIQIKICDIHQSIIKQFVKGIRRTVLFAHGIIILMIE